MGDPKDNKSCFVRQIEKLTIGGVVVLQNVQSALIEINDDFRQQAEDATHYLIAAGLQLKEKRRWKGTGNSPFEATYNQIWYREHGL